MHLFYFTPKTITGNIYKSLPTGFVPEHYMDIVDMLVKENKLTKTKTKLNDNDYYN